MPIKIQPRRIGTLIAPGIDPPIATRGLFPLRLGTQPLARPRAKIRASNQVTPTTGCRAALNPTESAHAEGSRPVVATNNL